jgi:glycosyltransferase involved in cell wall biosynthesis
MAEAPHAAPQPAAAEPGTAMQRRSVIRKLSILIPVYNEIRTLRTLLDKVLAVPLPCDRELVIVDDGSKDGSRDVLREYAARYPGVVRVFFHKKNGGKGKAIRSAISQMQGDWAIIQDADLEYDPADYMVLLEPVEKGIADAVFGSRFLSGRYRRAMFFWHTMVNKFLTLTSNVLNDLNLTDMETCYKLMRADILRNMVIRSKGFDLEPELTAKLALWGARIYEVPISYRGRTYAEGKKIGVRDVWPAFSAMFKYRFASDYTRHDGFAILQAVRKARRFNRWLFDQFSSFLGEEVLEAGCGIGNLTEMVLNKRRLVALDCEDFYVERLRTAYGHMENLTVGRADLTQIGDITRWSGNKPFDSVFCINVLEHIEADETVLKNFHSVLKPGGHAIILVPNDPDLYSEVDRTLGHFRRYTQRELREKLERAGFRVVKTSGFNRVGGLGWRLSGMMGKTTLSGFQMSVFEALMPLVKIAEHVIPHSPNSLIAIARKEA